MTGGLPPDAGWPGRFAASATLALALLSCAGTVLAAPGDVAAGRAKAQSCAVCHGALGVSTQPDAPNLAAQPALYLSTQLRAFRSGERRHEVMNLMAKPLTDDDIEKLALWFSSIKIEATAPP